jgi:transposase
MGIRQGEAHAVEERETMDERVLFVADFMRELYKFRELCSRYGISRKTDYKWVE